MPTIPNAPSGENSSPAGTEKFPVSGSQFMILTTLRSWLKTYFDTLYATGAYPPGHLYGLTLSNNATDPTNDIDVAVGNCRDKTDAQNIVLLSGLTKQLDAAWSVGNNAGMLDTGAIANATYHIYLIKRSDTGVVDVLASTSASSPTMPTNYDYKRRIGSIVRSAGALLKFKQDGDEFIWDVPAVDANGVANPGTSAVTLTLTVPTGIRVRALIDVIGAVTGGNDNTDAPQGVYVSDLSRTDTAASLTVRTDYHWTNLAANTSWQDSGPTHGVWTNTSAQIRYRLQRSTANTRFYLNTHGWIDRRGRLA